MHILLCYCSVLQTMVHMRQIPLSKQGMYVDNIGDHGIIVETTISCAWPGVLIVSGEVWVQGTELGAAADEMCVTWMVGTEIWPAADTPPLLRFQKWLGTLLCYCLTVQWQFIFCSTGT